MTDFQTVIIPDVKNLTGSQLLQREAKLVLEKLKPEDHLILLDERGKSFSSVEFARMIEDKQMQGIKKIVFLIGGAYGFDQSLYDRANGMLSLSRMTFSHQLIRLIFLEQLYRAHTIIKGLPYHHE